MACIQALAVSLVLMLSLAVPVQAAKWGPNGHPALTFDVAVNEYELPVDLSKVIAFGSAAPDHIEFSNYAAHAQTPDSSILPGAGPFEDMHRAAFHASEVWYEDHFNKAVVAMQQGQRERAAFLLGYAIHNREDFATHRGNTNLLHSALDYGHESPDSNPSRLAAAHEMAALSMVRFKDTIGPDHWRLFRGEFIKKGAETITPSPLIALAPGLKDWDPRSGVIPADISLVLRITLNTIPIIKLLVNTMFPTYSSDIKGRIYESLWIQVKNSVLGFMLRDKVMREMLGKPTNTDWETKLLQDLIYAIRFRCDHAIFETQISPVIGECLPSMYLKLKPSDQRLLGQLQWDKWIAPRILELRKLREAHRREFLQLRQTNELMRRDQSKWQERKRLLAIRVPTIHVTPPEPAPKSSNSEDSEPKNSRNNEGPRSSPNRLKTLPEICSKVGC